MAPLTYSPTDADRRLDQAWATPALTVRGVRILDATVGPELPTASDHYPLLIEL